MDSTEFAELNAFVEVAERNNFARSAAFLGIAPSTISQMIRSLEQRLGVRLFNRTTRSVALTDAGERLLGRIRPAIMELGSAVDGVNEFRDKPTGTLRLNVSGGAAQVVLAPAIKSFLAAYPSIVLDISVDDGHGDMTSGRFDAGIRVGRRVAKDMQIVRVSEASSVIAVAAPGYLEGRPPIEVPQDLQEHNCIRMRSNGQVLAWEFAKDEQKIELAASGSLVLDSMHWVLQAVLDGIGVGYMLESYAAPYIARGLLLPLLKDWANEQHIYYLYYPGRQQLPVPLKVFIAFLRQHRTRNESEGKQGDA
jgi:DNA-binding transcriptional LysR family regulator